MCIKTNIVHSCVRRHIETQVQDWKCNVVTMWRMFRCKSGCECIPHMYGIELQIMYISCEYRQFPKSVEPLFISVHDLIYLSLLLCFCSIVFIISLANTLTSYCKNLYICVLNVKLIISIICLI